MKRVVSLLLAAVLVFGVFGCTMDPGTSKTEVYKSLFSSDVETLNYLNTTSTANLGIPANCEEGLVEYDTYGNEIPALATEWSVSPDGLTWTFKIREGVQWLNYKGEKVGEVTAEDFVAAAKYALMADADAAYMYSEAQVAGAADFDPETDSFDVIGVAAPDKYTLEFKLSAPCPYFLSSLSYGCFFPIASECLKAFYPDWENCDKWTVEEWDAFSETLDGITYDKLWYCGAYYLSKYAASEEYILTKNPTYWDKDKVYISSIVNTYNKEAATISAEMYLRGEVHDASITSTMAEDWMNDAEKKQYVHPDRIAPDYSYFFQFCFDPKFDAEYEPENWKIAVNNENFRLSILHGLDRLNATKIADKNNAEALLQNTLTPSQFVAAGGKDYADQDQFKNLEVNKDAKDVYFDETLAKEYRDKAKAELAAAGASFPIKMPITYNPNVSDWDAECVFIKQQLETLLGTDYIEITVVQGPTSGFLKDIRRSGNYAFLKCNYGADYADPLTYMQPFTDGNTYQFMYRSEDPTTKALFEEFSAMIDKAIAITGEDQTVERYAAFADAEAFLIEHALAIPFGLSGGYTASYLNPFEGQYAPYGLATLRYKGMHIMDKPLSADEFNALLAKWNEERAAASK